MHQLNHQAINRFLSDQVVSENVYDCLLQTYLHKKKDEDVQMKAARMLAVELLEEAWKEMEKSANQTKERSHPKQVAI